MAPPVLLQSNLRPFVPTWTINYFGFLSSTSSILSTMSPLVAPVIFQTSTFFDLDNPLPLILLNTESTIITTFFDLFIKYFHRDVINFVAMANLRGFFMTNIAIVLIY